jgi:hypothetical protein
VARAFRKEKVKGKGQSQRQRQSQRSKEKVKGKSQRQRSKEKVKGKRLRSSLQSSRLFFPSLQLRSVLAVFNLLLKQFEQRFSQGDDQGRKAKANMQLAIARAFAKV